MSRTLPALSGILCGWGSDHAGTSPNVGDPATGDPWHLLYLLSGAGRHLPASGQFGACRYRF